MKRKIIKDIIIDRKSKYTVVCDYIETKEDLNQYFKTNKDGQIF